MRKYLVGGNWKCNGTMDFAKKFPTEVLNKLKFDPSKVDVVVAPTALHIPIVQSAVGNNVNVATQNLSLTGDGAFTGELSAAMIKDAGIKWTLTGHSERRTLYGESDEDVAKKTKAALDAGFSVLACIGELKEEREGGITKEVNERQLNAIRAECDDWSNIVIAYEPVWAIGTGLTATPEVAQETHAEIREWLGKSVSKEAAASVRILYGGSVSDANAAELIAKADIDGFLVGGASLKPAFHTIVEACDDAQK
jgi:triosephosphate isomerase (TIM)